MGVGSFVNRPEIRMAVDCVRQPGGVGGQSTTTENIQGECLGCQGG